MLSALDRRIGFALMNLNHRRRGFNPRVDWQRLTANWRMPAELARTQQDEQVRRLIRQAYTHVPYYHDLMQSLRLTPDAIRTAADLALLPPLTKEIIREQGDRMLADNFPRHRLRRLNTGGSTGEPLVFYAEIANYSLTVASLWRAFVLAGWRPGETYAYFWGDDKFPHPGPLKAWAQRMISRRIYLNAFEAGALHLARFAERMLRVRPTLLVGYTSTVESFCRFCLDHGIELSFVRGSVTTAEALRDFQRQTIEQATGARVTDFYGSSEIRGIGTQCAAGRMHICADLVVVQEGEGEVAGARPLLLTALHNHAMPFIRYRNGDCGLLSGEPCTCGCGFPLLELKIARVTDLFRYPDGRLVHGEHFTHLMHGSQGVVSFQFHQTTPETIILRIVRSATFNDDAARFLHNLCEKIRAESEGAVSTRIEYVEHIEKTAAGKHRFTVSDVK